MNRVVDLRGPVPVILLSAVAAALVFGCKPHTRDNPDVCNPENLDYCVAPLVCNEVSHRCVTPESLGGASGEGGMPDTTGTGGLVGSGGVVGLGGSTAGGKGGVATGGAGGRAGSGGKAGAGGTPVECSETKACPVSKPICLASTCVVCKSDGDCKDTTPICSPDHTCISCTSPAADAKACASHPGKTACTTTGDYIGACMECDKHTDCGGLKPVCSLTNACIACRDDMSCKTATNNTLPVCVTSGTQMGSCVQCGKDADCSVDPNKPFCSAAGTCTGCDPTAMGACGTRTPGKPVCSSSGACVQCVGNLDCDSKTPVCSSGNTCGPCSGDNDCVGRYGPTICMTTDGHCAVDSETIYVQTSAACTDAPVSGGGTPTMPYCNLAMVPAAVTSSRNVVVVRGSVNSSPMAFGGNAQQLWIVGQKMALIGGVNTGIRLTAGEATIRDITISRTGGMGIQADPGSTLHLQHVTISDNPMGGILLDGAGFDIQGTTVKNNGPGDMLGAAWGGIRINNPPSAGPKQLQSVTVQANNAGGISCTAAVQANAVLVVDNTNTPNQITPLCMITSCAAAGPTCGAQ